MSLRINGQGTIEMDYAGGRLRAHYRRPEPGELIDAMARKMPTEDEAMTARNVLMANHDLGLACIAGVGEGDLAIDGEELVTDPDREGYRDDWRDIVARRAPLVLIALGQHLSAPPLGWEEAGPKKSLGMPARS